jgi:hypothetical protein
MLRNRARLLFQIYIAPRLEMWIAGGMFVTGILMIMRGTLLSSVVGLLVVLASLLFLAVISGARGHSLTKKDASDFLEIYYTHPIKLKDKPNVDHMSLRDILHHVGNLIERVPETRAKLLLQFNKDEVDKWEGPVRDFVTKFYAKQTGNEPPKKTQ